MAVTMTMDDALAKVIVEEMRRDPTIFIYGWPEGAQFFTRGPSAEDAVKEFGYERVRNSGICEAQEAGLAVGAALAGTRPICDLQKPDFILDGGLGQIVQQAAQMRSKTGVKVDCPAVFLLISGIYGTRGPDHTACFHNWLANSPNLLVAIPSMPADAVGLMRTSLRTVRDPVAFLWQSDGIKPTVKGPVPEEDYTIPFGKAEIKREGRDVTIAAVGYMVHLALAAAEDLATSGISAEVWDPRTLTPFDRESLIASVQKTGAMVVVDQAPKSFGTTGEFFATVAEAMSPNIPPMARVAAMDCPGLASAPLKDYILPSKDKIISAVQKVLTGTVGAEGGK